MNRVASLSEKERNELFALAADETLKASEPDCITSQANPHFFFL